MLPNGDLVAPREPNKLVRIHPRTGSMTTLDRGRMLRSAGPILVDRRGRLAVQRHGYPVHPLLLLDPKTRAFYESQGWTLEEYLQRGIEMDNAIMGDFPEVTFGFHL